MNYLTFGDLVRVCSNCRTTDDAREVFKRVREDHPYTENNIKNIRHLIGYMPAEEQIRVRGLFEEAFKYPDGWFICGYENIPFELPPLDWEGDSNFIKERIRKNIIGLSTKQLFIEAMKRLFTRQWVEFWIVAKQWFEQYKEENL